MRLFNPKQLPNAEMGGPGFKPAFRDKPRYTLITVTPVPAGPWIHRFNIPGEEIVITPVNDFPNIYAEDNEDVPAFNALVNFPVPGSGTMNSNSGSCTVDGTGMICSFALHDLRLSITLPAYVGPGTINIAGFVVAGVAHPSLTNVQLTLPATTGLAFAGGGPGVVVIQLPATSGSILPPVPGDLTVTVVNPLALGLAYTIYPTSGQVIQYPAYSIPSTFSTLPSNSDLWGYLFFDDAIRQNIVPWYQGGGPAGIVAIGALGISNAQITKARQVFDHFDLNYIRNVVGHGLLIEVRHGQTADSLDIHPT